MIKVTYQHANPIYNQQSHFANQEALDLHKTQYPDMYDPEFYTVTEEDITAELALAAKLESRKLKRQFGGELKDFITELNKSKGLTLAQFDQLLADPQILKLVTLLDSGSLELATMALDAYTGTVYTADDKALMKAKINAFFAKLG